MTRHRYKVCYRYTPGYKENEIRNLKRRIGKAEKERVKKQARRELDRIAGYLLLQEEIYNYAWEIFCESLSSNISYNNSIAGLVAGSTYSACREKDFPRSLTEIAGASVLTENRYLPARHRLNQEDEIRQLSGSITHAPSQGSGSKIRKVYNKMKQSAEITVENKLYSKRSFLCRYTDLLDLDDELINASQMAIQKHESLLGKHSSPVQAASSLWYVIDQLGVEGTLQEVSIAAGINQQWLSKVKKSIE